MQKKWKEHIKYLETNVEKKSLEQMANELKVEKEELRLFLHFNRKFKVNRKDNLVIRVLTELVVYPEYFTPTKRFYRETGIGQRRWYQLYKGEKRITEREYKAFCNHMKVDSKTAMNCRQLDLFENEL